MGKLFTKSHGSASWHESICLSSTKELATLLGSRAVAGLASEHAFSCTDRSRKVRDPGLRAAGTECLQASQCTLLLPEVSGAARLPFEKQTLLSGCLVWAEHLARLGVTLGDTLEERSPLEPRMPGAELGTPEDFQHGSARFRKVIFTPPGLSFPACPLCRGYCALRHTQFASWQILIAEPTFTFFFF